MTPIADMIERMHAAGVTMPVILDAVRTAETACDASRYASRYASRIVTPGERSPGAIRAARYRENIKQKQALAKANDVANVENLQRDGTRDASRSTSDDHLLTKEVVIDEGFKKERKKVSKTENARARGQRMVSGSILTDDFLDTAIKVGATDDQARRWWPEFVDYWVAVPGQRGVSLDWLATWRNNVRRNLERKGQIQNAKPRNQSIADRAGDLARVAESAERAAGVKRSADAL